MSSILCSILAGKSGPVHSLGSSSVMGATSSMTAPLYSSSSSSVISSQVTGHLLSSSCCCCEASNNSASVPAVPVRNPSQSMGSQRLRSYKSRPHSGCCPRSGVCQSPTVEWSSELEESSSRLLLSSSQARLNWSLVKAKKSDEVARSWTSSNSRNSGKSDMIKCVRPTTSNVPSDKN